MTGKVKKDSLTELLVTYCKIQGSVLSDVIQTLEEGILNISNQIITKYLFKSKISNYYVFLLYKNIDGKEILEFVTIKFLKIDNLSTSFKNFLIF